MSWEPIDLSKIGERPPTEPTLGGVGLVYPGKRHVFSGPQESAKTLAAYAIALEEIRRGGTVVLIDLEMGPWDARDRLRELRAIDEDFERLHYIEPETPATEEIILGLVELKPEPTLVIVDAAAGAYDLQGLDDNRRADVERFAGLYVRTFFMHEIATILIDHVVKNAEHRGRYAIGSERKIGGADVHLGFEAVTTLSRGGTGVVKIATHKDRFGHLPRPKAAELALRSDPVTHAISWTFRPAPAGDPDQTFRPTVLMERVSQYVSACNGELPSRNLVEENVKGKRDYVRRAIDVLLAEDYLTERPGARGARLLESVRPYRESDDDAVGDLAPPRPDLARAKSSHPLDDLAPPLLRGEVEGARSGEVRGTRPRPNSGRAPLPGDDGFIDFIDAAYRAGHVTAAEALERKRTHRIFRGAGVGDGA